MFTQATTDCSSSGDNFSASSFGGSPGHSIVHEPQLPVDCEHVGVQLLLLPSAQIVLNSLHVFPAQGSGQLGVHVWHVPLEHDFTQLAVYPPGQSVRVTVSQLAVLGILLHPPPNALHESVVQTFPSSQFCIEYPQAPLPDWQAPL
jgi:hypothetical protein